MIIHYPQCLARDCNCEPDEYGHMWSCPAGNCICKQIKEAYNQGWDDAIKFGGNLND